MDVAKIREAMQEDELRRQRCLHLVASLACDVPSPVMGPDNRYPLVDIPTLSWRSGQLGKVVFTVHLSTDNGRRSKQVTLRLIPETSAEGGTQSPMEARLLRALFAGVSLAWTFQDEL